MPDFHENGVKRCARLQSKKSVSGAVKKFRAAALSRKMSKGGGLIQPPPGLFRVKLRRYAIFSLKDRFFSCSCFRTQSDYPSGLVSRLGSY